MKPKVSIIMPVYNSDDNVESAIKSVIVQSYSEIELLIVDDGSVDNSFNLCMKYADLDNRIHVFHQRNRGPSSARNLCLSKVTGDYLMFIDADDRLAQDAIERAMARMEKCGADVCIYSWNVIKGVKKEPYLFSRDEVSTTRAELYNKLFWKPYYCGGGNPWNKLWKVSSIKKNDKFIIFDEEIRIFEDMLWCLQNYEYCQTICFLNEPLYDYYIFDSSISRKGNKYELYEQYYNGAWKVYRYLEKNHPECQQDVRAWIRMHTCRYYFEKNKSPNGLSKEELVILRSFPIMPLKHDRLRAWIKYLFLRLITNRTIIRK